MDIMGQNSKNFENLFRKLSEQRLENPSMGVLRKLRFRLWIKDFFSLNLRKVNIIYSVALAGGIASGVYYFQKSAEIIDTTAEEASISIVDESSSSEESAIPETPDNATIREEKKKTINKAMLMAMFEAKTVRGCAPLHIQFFDRSVKAQSWHWDFGTGDQSVEQNPSYTYKTPGVYKASLSVLDENGNEDILIKEIEVLKKPTALFDIDLDNSEIVTKKIVFKNASKGASSYLWDFGDNTQLEASQASHVYNDYGVYQVKLIAKSTNGCSDTATLINKFINQNYELSFPTSFKPNPFDRSNNGFYESANNEAFIFYPKNHGAKEYNLFIYTSDGIKVFETNNIKQGWNGYFGGSLAPRGFYSYVARGIYPNGKAFEIKGKVKVIIEDFYYKF